MDQIKTPEQLKQEEAIQNYEYPFPKYKRHILKTTIVIFADVILLILIAIGTYFLASPVFQSIIMNGQKKSNIVVITPTGTSAQNPLDWQVYNAPSKLTTAKSPYSFKYPPNWIEAVGQRYVQSNYIEDTITNNTSYLSKRYIFTVDTIMNKNASTLGEFISQHQTNTAYPDFALNSFSKDTSVKISDINWMIDRDVSNDRANETVILLKGNTAVLLTCTNCGDDITNQILSTFKFTE